MSAPSKYDIVLTDADGESHGFVADWSQGGVGLTIEKGTTADSTAVSTKGNYGVRDVNDHHRIIQTDWSQGTGQKTYDREVDSESAFEDSRSIDVSTVGEFKLGPQVSQSADSLTVDVSAQLPAIIAHGNAGTGEPLLWAAFADATQTENRIAYSADGITWYALSNTSSPGPDASITSFASDGETLYAAGSKVWLVGVAQATQFGSDTDITHIAYTAGYLYGAKGTTSTDAQVGWFSDAGLWSALSPAEGSAINAAGTTFGLVALGSYVYWGVTNGMITSVYKARYGGATGNDVLALVATFPTGFVGASMYAYLDTVYVGGHWDSTTTTKGLGAIYAVVEDTPALLTDVGDDPTLDNRVLSISAYERGLYFISRASIWRWDLVNGGYSHWAGPLNSTATLSYTDIGWDTWEMTDEPGTGAETDATLTESGTVAELAADGLLNISLGSSTASATYETTAAVSGFNDDSIGETMEVSVPANFIDDHSHQTYLEFGIKGSAHGALAKIYVSPVYSMSYNVTLRDGDNASSSVIGYASITKASAHTLRLTISGSTATLYCDGLQIATGNLFTSITAKKVWFKAGRSGTGATYDNVHIDRVRWTDDGAFSSTDSLSTPVNGVALACWRDKVAAACSGVGCTSTSATAYRTVDVSESEAPPYIKSSRSAGNMPTVEKYFTAIHVSVSGGVPSVSDITVSGTVDGQPFVVDEDTTLSTDSLLVFPIGLKGRNIQYQINIENDDTLAGASGASPVITEVAVLFEPMPKTNRLHSYYLRVWEAAEGPDGNIWDDDATTCAEWLEEVANTIVTVSRPGRDDFTGRIDALKNVEAPPSGRTSEREGLYEIHLRELA